MAQESAQGLEQQLDSVHLDEGEDAEWEDVSQLDDETLSSMAAICQKYNVPELVISVTETLRFIVGDEMVEEDTVVHATGVVPQATSDALEACVSELKSVTPELLSSAVAGPAPGDPVPSIAVTPLGSASTQPLDEFCRASVVLIDFWCSEFPESMAVSATETATTALKCREYSCTCVRTESGCTRHVCIANWGWARTRAYMWS
eukprot:m.87421 g.87421  ORF g.87421 m.87421 type:complete len:204 (+) comp12829_c0_seq3:41-652(+)